MHEAIERLTRGGVFLFVAINEDMIPGYTRQLPVMRDTTETPIFVITSSYTREKSVTAMSLGANVYNPFAGVTSENVHAALDILKQQRDGEKSAKPPPVLFGGDIVLSSLRRVAFVNDTPVELTKTEFDILRYLMANRGIVLTHSQILWKIRGDDYMENGQRFVWRALSRLRIKLAEVAPEHEYIKAEYGVGYKFLS
jgi:DNA-binding response OmpR family regulator